MSVKKTAKTVDVVSKQVPAAAKPLSKSAPAKAVSEKSPATKAPTPVLKTVKPVAAKAVQEVKATVKAAKEPKVAKKPKPKVVRDSFTMPQSEYQKIAVLKEIGLKAGLQVKKSEVLRAGVIALCAMNEEQLKAALSSLDKIKTGRPNKH